LEKVFHVKYLVLRKFAFRVIRMMGTAIRVILTDVSQGPSVLTLLNRKGFGYGLFQRLQNLELKQINTVDLLSNIW
jgi:hypothetical protein